mgnify:CR=1 FL=1
MEEGVKERLGGGNTKRANYVKNLFVKQTGKPFINDDLLPTTSPETVNNPTSEIVASPPSEQGGGNLTVLPAIVAIGGLCSMGVVIAFAIRSCTP